MSIETTKLPGQPTSIEPPSIEPSPLASSPIEAGNPGFGSEPSRLGRFRLGRLLGEGGMGRVYEARDPHLHRTVAIKVLHGAGSAGGHADGDHADEGPQDGRPDPSWQRTRRFLREARVQGSLDHPGICPVYEVGEDRGTPYIVMRRIEGRRLDQVGSDLPLERRLRLLIQVADAVHAAHREGLIHRDLKPGNVLVSRDDDGALRPVVLDFGLARPAADTARVADAELTRAGEVYGTPAYMAPEQRRGEPGLDRRTDVYALGATLYHLLAGRAPISESELRRAGFGRALLAPSLRPYGVPTEVEAIVFRCLEDDAEKRYGSARALADDLRRYLDGLPVEARAAGPLYRLRKHLWRHRGRWAWGSVAVLGVLLALGWGAWTRQQASERERWSRELGEQVREVEALVRYSHMAPLHDTGPDRARVRQRLEALARDERRRGDWGGIDYAIGRGLLALDQLEGAFDALERAWSEGYRNADSARALAEASSQLYRQGLVGAELARDWPARQRRLRELDLRWGQRVSELLEEVPREPYLDALRHFHAQDYGAALALLADDRERPAWAYEWHALEGDIARTEGTRAAVEQRPEEAEGHWRRALRAYERASDIAPSDPRIARSAAQVEFLRLQVRTLSGAEVEPIFVAGMAHLARARTADPSDPRTLLWQSRLARSMASALRTLGRDPTDALDRALAAADAGLALEDESVLPARAATEPRQSNPSTASLHGERARILWGRAQWIRQQGGDPRADLEAAAAAFARVPEDLRDYPTLHTDGLLHLTLGDFLAADRARAAASYARAGAAFEAAAEHHSHPFAARSNQGVAHFKRARLLPVDEALRALDSATAAFETAHRLQPEHVAPLYYLARIELLRAQGGRATSGTLDPLRARRAIELYERALAVSPGLFQLHSGLGEVQHLLAIRAWDWGEDPSPWFERARASYGAALAAAPESPTVLGNLAWTAYFEGKLRLRAGQNPEPFLAEALELLEGIAGSTSESAVPPGALLCRASAWRLRAEQYLDRGQDPGPALGRSRAALDAFSRALPDDGEGHRSSGRLETLVAEARAAGFEIDGSLDPAPALERAEKALSRGLERVPRGAVHHLAVARLAVVRLAVARLAVAPRAGGPPTGEDDLGLDAVVAQLAREGIEHADQALRIRPGWPEARAVRATLSEQAAETESERAAARAERAAALELNPHLRARWRSRPALDRRAAARR